MNSINQKLF